MLLLAACTAPEVASTSSSLPSPTTTTTTTTPTPTPTTPTTTPTPGLLAACAFAPDNALRGQCDLTLPELGPTAPRPAEIELTDGVETVRFTAADPSTTTIPFWGLHAESGWTWTARAGGGVVTGELAAQPLPPELTLEVTRSGAGPHTWTQVLVPLDCDGGGWITVLDLEGRVRWYADTGGDDVDMTRYTAESGTFAYIADKLTIGELDLLGQERFRRADLGVPVHHDVFRRGDRIYTFLAQPWLEGDGKTYVEDVVVALDPAGLEVWRWDEHDHLDATLAGGVPGGFWGGTFPGAIDAWHTNGLYVTEDDDVLISLKNESTLMRISGVDGSTEWTLAGDGVGAVFPSTFSLVSDGGDAGFAGEHDPALLPDGHVTLFDNSNVRGLELALDETAGTATFADEWRLAPLSCPVQSSVFPVADGHHLLTCAEDHVLVEFDAAGLEVGRMELGCDDADPPRTARGQPVDLWDGAVAGGVTATRVE